LTYHHGSGLFARGRLTFVRQEIQSRNEFAETQVEREHFSVFDLSFGTRLPRRHGMVSIDIKNLFDEQFRFRDTTFEGFPRVPQYAPERAVYARLQVNL
jgi:hypothetical protein